MLDNHQKIHILEKPHYLDEIIKFYLWYTYFSNAFFIYVAILRSFLFLTNKKFFSRFEHEWTNQNFDN